MNKLEKLAKDWIDQNPYKEHKMEQLCSYMSNLLDSIEYEGYLSGFLAAQNMAGDKAEDSGYNILASNIRDMGKEDI